MHRALLDSARSTLSRPWTLAAACWALVIAASALAVLVRPHPLPGGLIGRYFSNDQWAGAAALERVDEEIGSGEFEPVPALEGGPFSVEWSGTLVVREGGLHQVATKSRGPSSIWIDDRPVVENPGTDPDEPSFTNIPLSSGVHRIRVRYASGNGPRFLQLGQMGWRGRSGPIEPLVAADVSLTSLRLRELWPLALVAVWYLALLATAAAIAVSMTRGPRLASLREALADRWCQAALAVALLAAIGHVAYGLPSHDSLAPDEIDPLRLLEGAANGFRTWNIRWPPLHLYLLAGVLQPFTWAQAAFGLDLSDTIVTSAMLATMRLVTTAMVGAAVVLLFDTVRAAEDRVTAGLAALLLGSAPVVVHYSALAHPDGPHLFWMTASWWAWRRLTMQPDATNGAVLGAVCGLGLASKDQAYAFYLAAPIALAWLFRPGPGTGSALVRWCAGWRDRRLWITAGAVVCAFAAGHGLPWTFPRFADHVRFMLSNQVTAFRMVPATIAGQIDLLALTAKSLVWAAGLPLTAAAVAGIAVVFASPRARHRAAAGALVPLATYYVAFIAVILYVYDRFLIGMLPVAAAFGGLALRAPMAAPGLARALRFGPAVVLLGAALAGAAAINVTMLTDPRHRARAWIAEHMVCGSAVGVTYSPEYVPPLWCHDVWPLRPSQIETMVRWPRFFVFNDYYAARFARTPGGRRLFSGLRSGELGFRRVFRAEAPTPFWAPLYWEARFRNGVEDPETTLDKPLAAIEVWERVTN